MQRESDTEYSGLVELINIENNLNNYNNYIVDKCFNQLKMPRTCIDFGAGIGTLSKIIKIKYNISPICIEVDEQNITYLSERKLQYYKKIEDFKSGVDLIFSSNVLEHIENDESILSILNDKLNKNGFIYLYLPANMLLWSEMDESVGHYRRYSRSEIKKKLGSNGFEVISVLYSDSLGFFASLYLKIFGYNIKKGVGSPRSLQIYDRYIFPFSKFFDAIGFKFLFGKNIIAIAKKK